MISPNFSSFGVLLKEWTSLKTSNCEIFSSLFESKMSNIIYIIRSLLFKTDTIWSTKLVNVTIWLKSRINPIFSAILGPYRWLRYYMNFFLVNLAVFLSLGLPPQSLLKWSLLDSMWCLINWAYFSIATFASFSYFSYKRSFLFFFWT